MNKGPLNLFSQVVKWLDEPIYPNEKSLAKISGYIGSAITTIEHEKMALAPTTQKKALNLLTELIPGLSAMTFNIKGGKLDTYSIKIRGWEAEGSDAGSWFREISRYDRSADEYADNPQSGDLESARGHNKLARISLIASPQLLRLLNDVDGNKQDELLLLIKKGQFPPQLISDEELSRVETYNAWMKNNKEGDEPQKPARATWIDSIRGQVGLDVINYREIAKKIETSYPDEVFMGDEDDRTHLYNMIDLTEETNDLEDIPQPSWDSGSTFNFG